MAFLDKKFTKSNHTIDKSSLSISGLQRPLEALTAACQSHPSETHTNYCSNSKCLKPLCPDCIQVHLEQHKRSQLFPEIESLKNVRVKCIRKLHKLSEIFQSQLGGTDGPKSIEKICAQTITKLGQIKAFMTQSIEAYFVSLEETIKTKVSESSAVLQDMGVIHGRLRLILEELAGLDDKLHQNSPATIPTIEKVFKLDGSGLHDSFMNQLNNYNAMRRRANVDIHFDQGKFKQSLIESISFDRHGTTNERYGGNNDRHPISQHSEMKPTYDKPSSSQVMNATQRPMPTIPLEKTSRTAQISDFGGHAGTPIQRMETPKNQSRTEPANLEIRQYPRTQLRPFLHFFESDSKNLHLIELPSLQKKVVTLRSQYAIPHFHKSLLVSTGDIFITGGLIDQDTKNTYVGLYDLDSRSFNDSFASVMQRSSHSLCELDGMLYIIGGFGRDGAERVVEKVNIETGYVEKDVPSRYGGPNISISFSAREIVKLSDEGIEIFHAIKRTWTQVSLHNYIYYESCTGIDINDNQLFVFGGYTKSQPDGLDVGVTDSFVLDFSDRNNVSIRQLNRFRLPVAQGFWNHPPMIYRKQVYALQNIESEDTEDCMEHARRILKFDGTKWYDMQQ